jgi:16S rRNA processing protein RimM
MLKSIFEKQIQGDDQISLNDLVDYSVLDVSGNVLGTIRAYHDIPSNPLLIIEKDGQEFLIPFHDSYIEEIDTLNKKLICILPEGFAELND